MWRRRRKRCVGRPNNLFMPDFIYLASQSPRRSQLLEQLGVHHKLLLPNAHGDETGDTAAEGHGLGAGQPCGQFRDRWPTHLEAVAGLCPGAGLRLDGS